jgi:hypothetical protein
MIIEVQDQNILICCVQGSCIRSVCDCIIFLDKNALRAIHMIRTQHVCVHAIIIHDDSFISIFRIRKS